MVGLDALDDAVVAAVESTGRPVGDGEVPDDRSVPYAIVLPLRGVREGSIANPDEDSASPYRISCWGAGRWQARYLATQVDQAMQSLTVDGLTVVRVEPDGTPEFMRDDDTAGEPMFGFHCDYIIHTSP